MVLIVWQGYACESIWCWLFREEHFQNQITLYQEMAPNPWAATLLDGGTSAEEKAYGMERAGSETTEYGEGCWTGLDMKRMAEAETEAV